ncbi:similar to RIKEN cDNA 2500002L14; EST C77350, isoform CRA_c [Rattus norvegicus]|uniref:Similar to RIKEN cDNA 2500002L14; EST C77350, isoform CRA_c n=1 Tax=Rattus norvegicus TaxID=10116 RepID=A6IAB0_RAT|nr:similar to RIKEN cDNA 2500002L14; EST C77350, isoform CRA_c [Rattus norvegicus]EDL91029.1 similar to RIKEN cDNA 2500002L14; EST C77350, isoform CRA_c [Rattus norvegicus]EDL91030.1 similar to RIKEN cDNA 2500002L14; EST C77350, isoform CRA_c [Rattus norvegicus]
MAHVDVGWPLLRERGSLDPNNTKTCFWYKINAKKVEGAGVSEAGPATLQTSDHGNALRSTVEVGRGAAAPRGLTGPARGRL